MGEYFAYNGSHADERLQLTYIKGSTTTPLQVGARLIHLSAVYSSSGQFAQHQTFKQMIAHFQLHPNTRWIDFRFGVHSLTHHGDEPGAFDHTFTLMKAIYKDFPFPIKSFQ
jgi:hypothetical protein